jgi:NADPH-dependent curcumin reductase CurA
MLVRRPADGHVRKDLFRVEEVPIAVPKAGEVLLRVEYFSADPYLIRQLNNLGNYSPRLTPGAPMFSRTLGTIVDSKDPGWKSGDKVLAVADWGEYSVVDAKKLVRLDPVIAPLPAYLSVMGHSGLTAWGGLLDIGRPKEGETVLVTSAAGPVGQASGQMAKIRGCRVVGIAGGETKCRLLVEQLGFDACVDYRSAEFEKRLAAALPNGIDVHCESVGAATLDQALLNMNRYARIVLFGIIANYDNTPFVLNNANRLLDCSVTLRAFSVSEYLGRWSEFQAEMGEWVSAGKVRFRDTIHDGIDRAADAMVALTTGEGIGKHIVRVG